MSSGTATRSFDDQRRLVGLRLGAYVLGPRLGAGGTASVYLAREEAEEGAPGRLVGLKVIHDHLLEEGDFVRMFIDEANLARRMSHPNVVRVFEFGREGESLYLAMEYLHGQPLSRLFERLVERQQRLPFDLVMWIGARVADGLHHAHTLVGDDGKPLGVIHRDVSPQNVFVTYDGQVKLIDFGIAKAEGRLAKTTLGRIKGKFAYMAPEQVLGNDFDQRADLFALGATLYELAIGVRLFAGDDQTDTLQKLLFEEIPDPSEQDPNIPSELSAVIRKALAPEPEQRYGSAAQISSDLDGVLHKRGLRDGRSALAQLMVASFAGEIEERVNAIRQLQSEEVLGDVRESLVRITGEHGTPDGMAATRPVSERAGSGRRWLAIAGVVAVVAGVGATAMLLHEPKVEDAGVAGPEVKKVTFDIQVEPDVSARITVGGREVTARPAKVELEKGLERIEVVVDAEGYETDRMFAVTDRDQLLRVKLVKKVGVAASSGGDGAVPNASVKPVSRPPATGHTGPGLGGPKSTGTGSLVTEYPF